MLRLSREAMNVAHTQNYHPNRQAPKTHPAFLRDVALLLRYCYMHCFLGLQQVGGQ